MHEYSVCRQIIAEAQKHGTPVAITLEVGELAPITVRELKSHLRELIDWGIRVKSKKGRVACECGFKGKPRVKERGHDFLLLECPKCRGARFSEVIGDKIILKSVKVTR
ncbi:hydrogenase maturation nickel metallochaperone HypA [Candidatus Micrarchaeota archaeon]|nr:hydrogenase maturation nickel metallochaperone HypA [Candidatus Micrarchaeota archaeon]